MTLRQCFRLNDEIVATRAVEETLRPTVLRSIKAGLGSRSCCVTPQPTPTYPRHLASRTRSDGRGWQSCSKPDSLSGRHWVRWV